MEALGIYDQIFDPEIKTLARLERELTRAQKAWSATAQPAGSAPSFLDPHYAVLQKLRSEILQHREALGLTPKSLAKLVKGMGAAGPSQPDLIANKLDQIAAAMAQFDEMPAAEELLDADLKAAIAEDMG
jgi:hypothetical protein